MRIDGIVTGWLAGLKAGGVGDVDEEKLVDVTTHAHTHNELLLINPLTLLFFSLSRNLFSLLCDTVVLERQPYFLFFIFASLFYFDSSNTVVIITDCSIVVVVPTFFNHIISGGIVSFQYFILSFFFLCVCMCVCVVLFTVSTTTLLVDSFVLSCGSCFISTTWLARQGC